MTASAVTYAQLEDAVRIRADVVIGASSRWTTAKIADMIGRSLKKWQQLLVDSGDDTSLKVARVTTNPSAAIDGDGWAPRQYIAQPAGLFMVRGIDIYRAGNEQPHSMLTIDEAERNDPTLVGEWWRTPITGMPRFYRLGGTTASAANQNIIQVFPWADTVYTCDIRYIQAVPPTVAASTYDFVCGGEEFVILDAAYQILVADGRAGTAEAISGLKEERMLTEQNVLMALSRRSSFRKRDTWLERRNARRAGWWRYG